VAAVEDAPEANNTEANSTEAGNTEANSTDENKTEVPAGPAGEGSS